MVIKDLDSILLKAELIRWKKKFDLAERAGQVAPRLVETTLEIFENEFERVSFPLVFSLLKLLAVCPVTTASAERLL